MASHVENLINIFACQFTTTVHLAHVLQKTDGFLVDPYSLKQNLSLNKPLNAFVGYFVKIKINKLSPEINLGQYEKS